MDELRKIILEMIDIFRKLIPVEKNKLAAAAGYNVVSLEECMKKEQAAVLKLRGLDQKREDFLESAGWKGKTFRQILEDYEGGDREALMQLFEEFEQLFREFRDVNQDTNEVIRTNLHQVEKMAKDATFYPGQKAGSAEEIHYTSHKA